MDIELFCARFWVGPGVIRCPSCGRIYDPMEDVDEWGIAVAQEADGNILEAIDICKCCLSNPEQIDLDRFEQEHRRRGTTEEYIEVAVSNLRLLKEGKLSPAQVVG